MFSHYKNSYLQSNCKSYDPGVLNRTVQRAWDEIINIDEHDLSPPFNRLTSEQPHIPVENVDVTRRAEGFGRSFSFQRRELHHTDLDVVLASLTTISDLVHDPERCPLVYLAFRLVDLVSHDAPVVRERAVLTLKVMAGVAMGKEVIVNNEGLLTNQSVRYGRNRGISFGYASIVVLLRWQENCPRGGWISDFGIQADSKLASFLLRGESGSLFNEQTKSLRVDEQLK